MAASKNVMKEYDFHNIYEELQKLEPKLLYIGSEKVEYYVSFSENFAYVLNEWSPTDFHSFVKTSEQITTYWVFTCSESIMKAPAQCVKSVQN